MYPCQSSRTVKNTFCKIKDLPAISFLTNHRPLSHPQTISMRQPGIHYKYRMIDSCITEQHVKLSVNYSAILQFFSNVVNRWAPLLKTVKSV